MPRSSRRSSSGSRSAGAVSRRVRTSAVVSSSAAGVGHQLDADPRARSSKHIRRTTGVDQIGREQRVVARASTRERLRIVHDEVALHLPWPGADHYSRRPLQPRPDRRRRRNRPRPAEISSSPSRQGDLDRVTFIGARRDRDVELIDAVQEIAELEAPEDLLQLRAIGRIEHELRWIAVDVEIAAHRREPLRQARDWSACSVMLRARRRELDERLNHLTASRTARSAGRRSCHRSPERQEVVAVSPLSPMKSGTCSA